jgi:glyoxalase family protein
MRLTMKLEGIHHITATTGNAPVNVDFYGRLLGLRLVKKTVNQDDPSVYHLFYADHEGSAGADLTFFEYPGARPGLPGAGMVYRVVFRVGSQDAIAFWADRLASAGVHLDAHEDDFLRFDDPEGYHLELAVDSSGDTPLVAHHVEIPEAFALQGFDGVRALSADPNQSASFLEEVLGFERVDPDAEGSPIGMRGAQAAWVARGENRKGWIAYDISTRRGIQGAGVTHHVAWSSEVSEIERWQERVAGEGIHPTPVVERFYFQSVYFREPSGVLFELATKGPGFTVDEPLDSLGDRVSLPPRFEPLRDRLEQILTPLPTSTALRS